MDYGIVRSAWSNIHRKYPNFRYFREPRLKSQEGGAVLLVYYSFEEIEVENGAVVVLDIL